MLWICLFILNICCMEGTRQHRHARQMLKDLNEVFQKDSRHFFGSSFVTLTEVDVSPDLSLAKVYFSVLPASEAEAVMERLSDLKSEVRKLLGLKIGKRIRKIPDLAFFYDDTQEKASKMDRLIDSLDIPKEKEE